MYTLNNAILACTLVGNTLYTNLINHDNLTF